MLGYILFKIKLKHLFFLILIASVTLYFVLINWWQTSEQRLPIILYWTPLLPNSEETIDCYRYRCLLTRDRNYINQTDVFLFYGSYMNISDLPLPKTKPWALLHEESPRNVPIFFHKPFFDQFELASTFSQFSDMPLTFQYLENVDSLTSNEFYKEISVKNQRIKLGQNAPVVYIQSDCDTQNNRDDLVRELMRYVEIDSFGHCLNNKQLPASVQHADSMDLFNEDMLEFLSNYKFAIAFENANCHDYITEKLWRPLIVGSVPIYFGASNVEQYLPNFNQSAVLVRNFPNMQKVGEFVNKLANDDELYLEFLSHKTKSEISNGKLKKAMERGVFGLQTDKDHPIPAFECLICRNLHENQLIISERSEDIYNCEKPDNSWAYFWEKGQCQGQILVDMIRHNKKLDDSLSQC